MALPVISKTDFKGWVKIVANQFKEVDLDEYIVTFREQYLIRIVGDASYSDIVADTRQKWTDLLNGVDYVDADGKRRNFPGLVKSLLLFIYFEFSRDNFTATQVGQVQGESSNSTKAANLAAVEVARSRYNAGVLSVNKNLPVFLEANADFSEEITGSVDNADNTYTLSIASTKYLEVGDYATINAAEYEVTAVTANVSITIDGLVTGLDFLGDLAEWDPYADLVFCEMEVSGI